MGLEMNCTLFMSSHGYSLQTTWSLYNEGIAEVK